LSGLSHCRRNSKKALEMKWVMGSTEVGRRRKSTRAHVCVCERGGGGAILNRKVFMFF